MGKEFRFDPAKINAQMWDTSSTGITKEAANVMALCAIAERLERIAEVLEWFKARQP